MDSAKRVISGTWGEVWLDNEYVGECYGLQAKDSYSRESVSMCGRLRIGKKLTSIEGSGSLKMHKVNSRMAIMIGEQIKRGADPRFTVISKLDDPDAYGAERISFTDVAFDDLTLADWEVASVGKIEAPFTYGDYEFLDRIEA